MLDYRAIEALAAVIELQSFEQAAKKLHITQSAVSQRIKGLESHYGEAVLIRALPYQPTSLGGYLIAHYKQVCLLEDSFEKQRGTSQLKPHISIAVNRDSLEMCFVDLFAEMAILQEIVLEIVADDQELTIEHFKKGLVSACLSTYPKEMMGGYVHFLGKMEYLLVASPEFIAKNFTHEDPKKSLLNAVAIKFDKKDHLHERYLEKFFGLKNEELNFQIVPSVRGFKQYALLGYGYGLIPKIDIREELENGQIIQLFKGKVWEVPLYWHYWPIESKLYKQFNAVIISYMSNKLSSS